MLMPFQLFIFDWARGLLRHCHAVRVAALRFYRTQPRSSLELVLVPVVGGDMVARDGPEDGTTVSFGMWYVSAKGEMEALPLGESFLRC